MRLRSLNRVGVIAGTYRLGVHLCSTGLTRTFCDSCKGFFRGFMHDIDLRALALTLTTLVCDLRTLSRLLLVLYARHSTCCTSASDT